MAAPKTNGATSPGTIKYAYMFESNRSPTMQFDALLRAIARFIATEVGDKNDTNLTPKKLAAFYKAVGGDYDSLFLSTPDSTIAYMWQVTGCQHSLQPTDDDFSSPSVPALTPRGFSRWESVEILLGPEEHVPFIQYAVKNWALRHPETGEIFPPDLPARVFPAQPDARVDRWHKSCADRMRDEASKEEEASMPTPEPKREPKSEAKPEPKHEPKPEHAEPKFVYVHTRDQFHSTPPRSRAAEADYLERPFTYVRVGERHEGNASQRSSRRSPERPPRERPFDDQARRRSFSDYASPPQPKPEAIPHSYSGTYLNPDSNRPGHPRRHSHPRHYSSESSADESVQEPMNLRARRRQQQHRTGSPPPSSVRRVVPPPQAPPPPPAVSNAPPSFRAHRSDIRSDDARRRSSPLGALRDKLSETVSNILPNSRNSSRHSSVNEPIHSRRSREHVPPSRLSQNHSDLASEDSSDPKRSEDERRRRRIREEREREWERDRDSRERDRYRDKGRPGDFDRERIDERESSGRRDRQYHRRPEAQRRTSSHADIDRRREPVAWDSRDRERSREERKKWDRWSAEEDLPSPPGPPGGMTGRRYPEPAYG